MNKFSTVGMATCIGMAALSAAHAQVCPSGEVLQRNLRPTDLSNKTLWGQDVQFAQTVTEPVSVNFSDPVLSGWQPKGTSPFIMGKFNLTGTRYVQQTNMLMCNYTLTIGGESFRYVVATPVAIHTPLEPVGPDQHSGKAKPPSL